MSMSGSILQPVGDSLASCWLEVTYFQSFASTIYYIKKSHKEKLEQIKNKCLGNFHQTTEGEETKSALVVKYKLNLLLKNVLQSM